MTVHLRTNTHSQPQLVLLLSPLWLGSRYSLLSLNCTTFCRELSYKLGVEEREFPEVRRGGRFGCRLIYPPPTKTLTKRPSLSAK